MPAEPRGRQRGAGGGKEMAVAYVSPSPHRLGGADEGVCLSLLVTCYLAGCLMTGCWIPARILDPGVGNGASELRRH
jgi:hypothetical protein